MSLPERAAENPDGIAARFEGGTLTFQALHERCRRLMTTLALERRSPGALTFVAQNDLDTFVLIHSLMLSGHTALPLHPRLTLPERDHLSRLAGAQWLERSEAGWSVAQTAPDGRARPHACTRQGSSTAPSRPQQVLIATSGSEGASKLVSLSRDAIAAAAEANAIHLEMTPADRWLLSLNLAHIGGYSILTRCLHTGAAVVLGPSNLGLEPLCHLVEREQVTLLSLVPTQLQRLLAVKPTAQLSSLRAILVGGAACPTRLFNEARAQGLPVLLTYGLSEGAAQVTTQPLSDLASSTENHTSSDATVDCGLPLAGVELRIVEDTLELRGPALFDGYVTNANAHLDRIGLTEDGFFRTGDLGHLTADGRFVPLGRRRDRIVTGGENVSPLELEAQLLLLPEVAAAAVVGIADPEWGQLVAAAVVHREGSPLDEAQWLTLLGTQLRSQLAAYKCPKRWLCLPELPQLPSGKLDRTAVARLFTPD